MKSPLNARIGGIRNPLRDCPSVLAAPDLRRQLGRWLSHAENHDTSWEDHLLSLDPLATLRGMRIAFSDADGLVSDVPSIRQLREALGRDTVRRLLDTPANDRAAAPGVRQLWLHSVATAHAARSLAHSSGKFDPDKAYVLGLLHDLPQWLRQLRAPEEYGGSLAQAGAWIETWHLPEPLQRLVKQLAIGSPSQDRRNNGGAVPLIVAAELLAEVSGFWHPGDEGAQPSRLLASIVDTNDVVAARNLRERVLRSFAKVGLDDSALELPAEPAAGSTSPRLIAATEPADLGELARSMRDQAHATDDRTIRSKATAAAVRYLGFDRAYIVKWSLGQSRCYLQAKADVSSQPLQPTTVALGPEERELLLRAYESGTSQHLINHDQHGLLSFLGADEALVTTIDQRPTRPSFLVMDRALSCSSIHSASDRAGADVLAATTALLTAASRLERQKRRAQKYALTDSLTRLFNRGVGINSLATELARTKRTREPLTVLMLDMDEFKLLNDTYGHVKGDQALRATAEVLRRTMRKADVLCRFGGEEFLAILPGTSVEDASVLATRIFTEVERAGAELDLPITISVGLSAVNPDDDDVESALIRADRALYASKSRGRNRFSVDEA